MKVLLVSDGKHELGSHHGGQFSPGALQILVKRALSLWCEFVSIPVRAVPRVHGRGGGLYRKVVRCLLDARQKHGCEALVFVVDEDGDARRGPQLDQAQEFRDHRTADVRRAVGLAIRSFDAWMLADERALSDALGRTVLRFAAPEQIRDPKSDCETLCATSSVGGASVFYAAVAAKLDFAQLCERCPKGFGTFARRLEQIKQERRNS
jgi:hypothetical protein